MQEANTDDVAVKIAFPVYYECLHRRFRGRVESWPNPNVCNTSVPLALNQRSGHVHAVTGYDAILRMQVGRGKAQNVPAFGSAFNKAFNSIWSTQESSRQIN